MKKALYTKEGQCNLCPHNCKIAEGRTGICKIRKNIKGTIYSMVYGNPCSINIDPVEKKPLYHFFPGKKILSLGTVGCNFSCKGCQNYEISKEFDKIDEKNISPKEIIKATKENGLNMIAYTYTEPTVFYEYMIDIAKLAKKEGIKNVIVSNGYINKKPLLELCKYIDAANIDLKFFDEKLYMKYSGGKLQHVLDSLTILKAEGVWIEITTLVIPGWSDDEKMVEDMCIWISKNLGRQTPLHLSRFFGMYKLKDCPSTDIRKLYKLRDIAKRHLDFVYVGNIGDEENTICLNCKKDIILRKGYRIFSKMKNDRCGYCDSKIEYIIN